MGEGWDLFANQGTRSQVPFKHFILLSKQTHTNGCQLIHPQGHLLRKSRLMKNW